MNQDLSEIPSPIELLMSGADVEIIIECMRSNEVLCQIVFDNIGYIGKHNPDDQRQLQTAAFEISAGVRTQVIANMSDYRLPPEQKGIKQGIYRAILESPTGEYDEHYVRYYSSFSFLNDVKRSDLLKRVLARSSTARNEFMRDLGTPFSLIEMHRDLKAEVMPIAIAENEKVAQTFICSPAKFGQLQSAAKQNLLAVVLGKYPALRKDFVCFWERHLEGENPSSPKFIAEMLRKLALDYGEMEILELILRNPQSPEAAKMEKLSPGLLIDAVKSAVGRDTDDEDIIRLGALFIERIEKFEFLDQHDANLRADLVEKVVLSNPKVVKAFFKRINRFQFMKDRIQGLLGKFIDTFEDYDYGIMNLLLGPTIDASKEEEIEFKMRSIEILVQRAAVCRNIFLAELQKMRKLYHGQQQRLDDILQSILALDEGGDGIFQFLELSGSSDDICVELFIAAVKSESGNARFFMGIDAYEEILGDKFDDVLASALSAKLSLEAK